MIVNRPLAIVTHVLSHPPASRAGHYYRFDHAVIWALCYVFPCFPLHDKSHILHADTILVGKLLQRKASSRIQASYVTRILVRQLGSRLSRSAGYAPLSNHVIYVVLLRS